MRKKKKADKYSRKYLLKKFCFWVITCFVTATLFLSIVYLTNGFKYNFALSCLSFMFGCFLPILSLRITNFVIGLFYDEQ